jgi:peptidoglycan/xylan/chitin deacetylase (PgdA/CDA1 family)
MIRRSSRAITFENNKLFVTSSHRKHKTSDYRNITPMIKTVTNQALTIIRLLLVSLSPPLLLSLSPCLLVSLSAFLCTASGQTAEPPVYITLWFDTEDFILPQSDDAAKRVAEILTRLGVKGTFKVVGEKARTLEKRGRKDVIAALQAHEIGYHSNLHSVQPTPSVYLQHNGWDDGAAEFYRREAQGVKDLERIFGVTPSCYGQPGASWAPQSYPALKKMGINMYLDEGDHVGIDDQPFYYGNMLNIFKMRSNLTRMELKGGSDLQEGQAKFKAAYDKLRSQGGGTISIVYHPCEWVHTEFWDGVNFSRGANPPRSEWKAPKTRPAAETEKAFADFEAFVKYMGAQPGVRFATASEFLKIYPDNALTHSFSRQELLALAKAVQTEIGFSRRDNFSLSAADVFSLLSELTAQYVEKNSLPASVRISPLYGPGLPYATPTGRPNRPEKIAWSAFEQTVRDVADFCRAKNQIPDAVWFGVETISPQDYLVTLASVVEGLLTNGKKPDQIPVKTGVFTPDRYIAEDSSKLWGWVIFPEGFRAPKVMEQARLQAWTLKPAVLQK